MDTYEKVIDAINAFFDDKSRSVEETKDGLLNIRDEVNMLLDAL